MVAFYVSLQDLAGNVQSARVTAVFSPPGYTPAAIQVPSGATLSIDSALPPSFNNILRSPSNVAYTAPYVWQSSSTTLEVNVFAFSHTLCF